MIALFVGLMVVPVYLAELLGLGNLMFGPFAWLFITADLAAAAGFMLVAINANRNYPLWVAGFQLVSVSAHVVKGLVASVSPLAYVILAVGPSYCQLLLIFAGFVRHTMRERRFGQYRDWRIPLPGAG